MFNAKIIYNIAEFLIIFSFIVYSYIMPRYKFDSQIKAEEEKKQKAIIHEKRKRGEVTTWDTDAFRSAERLVKILRKKKFKEQNERRKAYGLDPIITYHDIQDKYLFSRFMISTRKFVDRVLPIILIYFPLILCTIFILFIWLWTLPCIQYDIARDCVPDLRFYFSPFARKGRKWVKGFGLGRGYPEYHKAHYRWVRSYVMVHEKNISCFRFPYKLSTDWIWRRQWKKVIRPSEDWHTFYHRQWGKKTMKRVFYNNLNNKRIEKFFWTKWYHKLIFKLTRKRECRILKSFPWHLDETDTGVTNWDYFRYL